MYTLCIFASHSMFSGFILLLFVSPYALMYNICLQFIKYDFGGTLSSLVTILAKIKQLLPSF